MRSSFNQSAGETRLEIDRKIIRGCIGREQIKTNRRFDIGKYGVDHNADLEYALNKPPKIAPPVLHRFVRQTACIHRQCSPEPASVCVADVEHERRRSRHYVTIPNMHDRALARSLTV